MTKLSILASLLCVQGLGFGIQGLGFGIQGVGFGIQSLELEVWGLRFGIWAVVKMMVHFWIPIILRHLILRVPQKGPISLTTTHLGFNAQGKASGSLHDQRRLSTNASVQRSPACFGVQVGVHWLLRRLSP